MSNDMLTLLFYKLALKFKARYAKPLLVIEKALCKTVVRFIRTDSWVNDSCAEVFFREIEPRLSAIIPGAYALNAKGKGNGLWARPLV